VTRPGSYPSGRRRGLPLLGHCVHTVHMQLKQRRRLVTEAKSKPDSSRRAFLAGATVAVAVTIAGGLKAHPARAAGEKLPHLTDANAMAKALGYTVNHNSISQSKYPTYKAGDDCAGCRFFRGTPGEKSGYAGCEIFPGYSVAAQGWCQSFSAS
jgi:hypothetical protein